MNTVGQDTGGIIDFVELLRRNMKKALIVGAAGFVGNHLIDYIQAEYKEWVITATKIPNEQINKNVNIVDLDITQIEMVKKVLKEVKPDFIFHLAAQSSVALSWKNPQLTVNVNVIGTLNLLEAVRDKTPNARVLLIGSGEEYGRVKPQEIPIIEDNNTRPGNIYAVTKVTQNLIGKLYADAYGLNIMSTRSFNHTGPNQAPIFVVPDFCKQVAEIEKGNHEPIIKVGNLSAKRDFTDVRDVVRAYCLLMLKGSPGETYNVGSGKAIEISSILEKILALTESKIEVVVDKNKVRPIDVPIIEADITKLTRDTGWRPEISLDQTIFETLEVWRK